jgi:hypothetical protein
MALPRPSRGSYWWDILTRTMNKIFLTLCLALPVLHANAKDKPKFTKDVVRRAITEFRQDPTSDAGHAARYVVVNYGHDSPDVVIKLTPQNYPISDIKPASEDEKSTLLAAFIVGNLDSQLSHGTKGEDGYPGDLQLIKTYRQLQQKNRALKIAAIEKMAAMEERGELKRYLSSK